jgi:exodeoxyribonuclease V gamma subunit
MFYLYHHHDAERLLDVLALLQGSYPGPPLVADTVVVPNRGVARWVESRMAERHRIAANFDFPLPAQFFWQLLSTSLPDAPDSSAYEQEHLRWYLYALMPDIAREVPEVARYLDSPTPDLSRLQLAGRLADVFDEYLIYRRDMLVAWESGAVESRPPADWQARVWRVVVARLGKRHRARLLAEFVATQARDGPLTRSRWPARLYCFGLSQLPPDYLRLLYAFARERDVHFLLPNPSDGYWGDIDARRITRLADAIDVAGSEEERIAAEHPLLAAFGRPTRDLLRVLYSEELNEIQELELGQALAYEPPAGDTLLARMQRGVMMMDAHDGAQAMRDDDVSLQIHACHGPLREVQVLHDQLLDLMVRHPDLQPRDVVVMVPDMAAYAPAIHSVFGAAQGARRLPFTVSDQPRVATHPIARTFARLLALPLSRWPASEIMALAAVPAVMRRFELDDGDLDRLRHWINVAGIRWGRDAAARAAAGAGNWAQNSWTFGMDRLLLGVALADAEQLVDGVAPVVELEGGPTAALGRLWLLLERLSAWSERMCVPATAAAWRQRLNAMFAELVAPDPDDPAEARATEHIYDALRAFDGAEHALGDEPLTWEIVREVVTQALSISGERQPLFSGGINFCGLTPLRGLPFRVVALLGLNDGDFPRQDTHRGLNLVRLHPRIGDRSSRDEDRLLFLQSLLAARDVLYLSYTGQDVRSGERLAPSPVIGELLEFLHQHHFAARSAATVRERLVTEQPMQPFSARYATAGATGAETRVFTYNTSWTAGAAPATYRRVPLPAFADDSICLAPAAVGNDIVDLDSLRRFFEHPSRAFYRAVLQLELDGDPGTVLADDEVLELAPLHRQRLRDTLFEHGHRTGTLPAEPDAWLRAQGTLPPPPLDLEPYAAASEEVGALLPLWQRWSADPLEPAVAIDLSFGTLRLVGQLADVRAGGLRRLRPGKLDVRRQLRHWLDYLALKAAGKPGTLELAGLDSKGNVVLLAAELDTETARTLLGALIDCYRDGMTRPLMFLPDLAQRFLEKADDPVDALARCRRYLADDYRVAWERNDPYWRLVVAEPEQLGDDPAASEFCRLAHLICEPIVYHLRAVAPS